MFSPTVEMTFLDRSTLLLVFRLLAQKYDDFLHIFIIICDISIHFIENNRFRIIIREEIKKYIKRDIFCLFKMFYDDSNTFYKIFYILFQKLKYHASCLLLTFIYFQFAGLICDDVDILIMNESAQFFCII